MIFEIFLNVLSNDFMLCCYCCCCTRCWNVGTISQWKYIWVFIMLHCILKNYLMMLWKYKIKVLTLLTETKPPVVKSSPASRKTEIGLCGGVTWIKSYGTVKMEPSFICLKYASPRNYFVKCNSVVKVTFSYFLCDRFRTSLIQLLN